MNISNVTSNQATGFAPSALPEDQRQRMKDFRALARAVQSGDLDTAKEAYETFKKDFANATSTDPVFGEKGNAANQALDAVGKALESGDLDVVKEAFTTLRQEMQPAGGRPPGPPPGGAPCGECSGTSGSSTIDFQSLLDSANSETASDESSSSAFARSFVAFA